jgi:hypothetical protein
MLAAASPGTGTQAASGKQGYKMRSLNEDCFQQQRNAVESNMDIHWYSYQRTKGI